MEEQNNRPFELEDIEDVRVTIKANGRHYSTIKLGGDNEDLKDMNKKLLINCIQMLLVGPDTAPVLGVCSDSLEELSKRVNLPNNDGIKAVRLEYIKDPELGVDYSPSQITPDPFQDLTLEEREGLIGEVDDLIGMADEVIEEEKGKRSVEDLQEEDLKRIKDQEEG